VHIVLRQPCKPIGPARSNEVSALLLAEVDVGQMDISNGHAAPMLSMTFQLYYSGPASARTTLTRSATPYIQGCARLASKSVGAENTFSGDLTEFGAMATELQPLIDKPSGIANTGALGVGR
jgi:hypothetical protein